MGRQRSRKAIRMQLDTGIWWMARKNQAGHGGYAEIDPATGEEREINRWIDTNALSAFFFLLILSSQLKRLSVSQKRLSQQGTVSIICFLLSLFSLKQLNRRLLNVCYCKSLYSSYARTMVYHKIYNANTAIISCYLQWSEYMKGILNEKTVHLQMKV